jgi:hypothetical protein
LELNDTTGFNIFKDMVKNGKKPSFSKEIFEKIKNDKKLNEIKEIMNTCLEIDPNKRPNFGDLLISFENLSNN